MKRLSYLLLGILLYLLLLGLFFEFNWLKILQPVPLLSVVLGVIILTLSQYKKGMGKEELLSHTQWNAFFAGLLASLFFLLSLFSDVGQLSIGMLTENLIPLIYGSILYFIIDLFMRHEPPRRQEKVEVNTSNKPSDAFSPQVAHPILLAKGFSSRECHVALKLMEGISNKEIAQQLYISEATVKKHIQNMFKKCNATDRQNFLTLYLEWVDNHNQPHV